MMILQIIPEWVQVYFLNKKLQKHSFSMLCFPGCDKLYARTDTQTTKLIKVLGCNSFEQENRPSGIPGCSIGIEATMPSV